MVVRLLGALMVAAAGYLFWRPRSLMEWTAKVNEVFDRDTSRVERTYGVVWTYAFALVLVLGGLYNLALGTAALPDE